MSNANTLDAFHIHALSNQKVHTSMSRKKAPLHFDASPVASLSLFDETLCHESDDLSFLMI